LRQEYESLIVQGRFQVYYVNESGLRKRRVSNCPDVPNPGCHPQYPSGAAE
jgi:hypothetical protein